MKTIGISKYYHIYQKPGDRRFYVQMPEQTLEFRFCELLEFRGKVQAIDLSAHFEIFEGVSEKEIFTKYVLL